MIFRVGMFSTGLDYIANNMICTCKIQHIYIFNLIFLYSIDPLEYMSPVTVFFIPLINIYWALIQYVLGTISEAGDTIINKLDQDLILQYIS